MLIMAILLSYYYTGIDMAVIEARGPVAGVPGYFRRRPNMVFLGGFAWPYFAIRQGMTGCLLCSWVLGTATTYLGLVILSPHMSSFWEIMVISACRLLPFVRGIFMFLGMFIWALVWVNFCRLTGREAERTMGKARVR